MATKKRRSVERSEDESARTPPFTPEQFLALDNRAAERKPPPELADAARQRLLLYSAAKGWDPAFARSKLAPAAWELALPEGATLGLPGRKLDRLSVAEVQRGIKGGAAAARGLGEAFQPLWVDFTPHPKVTARTQPLLRRIDGRRLEPHYGVFGADDRQVYYPSGYPWTCVGKVYVWADASQPYASSSGSGVLIGDRVVLTAGHMVPWGSRNWAMQFVPAFWDGGSTLGRGVSSWVSDCYGYDTDDQVSAWDMAVLRLYTPLGSSYGYFGTKDYHSSWEGGNYWTLAGYPGAVAGGNRPSRQMWWPVLDDDSDGGAEEVEYEADASGGNSGGPVFGFWSGLPYAIATHSGGSKTEFLWWTIEDTNVGAGGGALNSIVAWARSNWP